MRLLLGSGGLRTPERLQAWIDALDAFLGDVESFLFIPYAVQDHDASLQRFVELGLAAGRRVEGIHRASDAQQAVESAEAIFISGGNSFRLLHQLYEFKLIDVIRQHAREGVPYMGISAGSNMACPTLMTTNDMPIVQPPSFEALNLLPIQINPHYFAGPTLIQQPDGPPMPYGGETRDDRLREFHEMNTLPVLGLWEGGILHVEGNDWRLEGCAGARLFMRGAAAQDLEVGDKVHVPTQSYTAP